MINNLETFLNKNIAAMIASDIEFTPIGRLAVAYNTHVGMITWEFITLRSNNVEEKLYSLGFEKRYTDTEAFVDCRSVEQPCSIHVLDKAEYAKELWVWNEVKQRYGKDFYLEKTDTQRKELLAVLRELYDSKLLQSDLTHLPQGVDFFKEQRSFQLQVKTLTPEVKSVNGQTTDALLPPIKQISNISVNTESSPTTILSASSVASSKPSGHILM